MVETNHRGVRIFCVAICSGRLSQPSLPIDIPVVPDSDDKQHQGYSHHPFPNASDAQSRAFA